MFAREIFNYLLNGAFLAGRQKDHSEAEIAGKADALFASAFAHEGIWDGHQQTGAVAATAIGVDTAAMGQAQQRSQGALHDLVRRAAAELGHEAHTTGVVVRGVALMCHLTLLAGTRGGSTTQNFDEADGFFGSVEGQASRPCCDDFCEAGKAGGRGRPAAPFCYFCHSDAERGGRIYFAAEACCPFALSNARE